MTEVIDFEDLLRDAKAGNAWPPGEYDFEVTEAHSVHASTGAPMIKTKLRCLVGAYAGKTVTNQFVLSLGNGAAVNIFLRNMATLGVTEQRFRELLPRLEVSKPDCLEPLARAIVGARCRIKLGHRSWQGMMQNNVEQISPIVGNLVGGPGNLAGPAGAVAGPSPAATGPAVPGPGVPAFAGGNPMSAPIGGASPNFPAMPPLPTPPQPQAAPPPQAAPTGPPPAPVQTPAPAPVAPAPVAPAPAPAAPSDDDVAPPGLEAIWGTLAPEARTAIRAQYAAPSAPPAPPALPV